MPLYTSKALHLKSIDYAQGLLFAYLYLAAVLTKSTHEWPRVTTNDHEWPRMTTSDHEWPRVISVFKSHKIIIKNYFKVAP
jgi:hypothetical protein